MEMDWKGNMAELGGAFMLSWVVLGMTGSGIGSLIGAATLAVAWMAFSGAHLLPIVTWCHMMTCLLYTSPSPRDQRGSRMPSSA